LIDKLFESMKKWKAFPNYKMETKVDIILSLYLKDILEYKYKKPIKLILPEFPVHLNTIYPGTNNKSVKIDFAALTEENHVYLIEFKTDDKSIRDEQIKYLKTSVEVGFQNLLYGLTKIYKATLYKNKYDNYFNELLNIGLMTRDENNYNVESKDYSTEIVFVVPNPDDPILKDFRRISLKECAKIIKNKYDDQFSLDFADVISGF